VTVLTVGPEITKGKNHQQATNIPEMIKAKDEPMKERCLKPRIL
jgi:hypothetical protein